MKKWKFAALLTAMALVLAPVSSVMADGTSTPTTTTSGDTGSTSTGGTVTTTTGDSGSTSTGGTVTTTTGDTGSTTTGSGTTTTSGDTGGSTTSGVTCGNQGDDGGDDNGGTTTGGTTTDGGSSTGGTTTGGTTTGTTSGTTTGTTSGTTTGTTSGTTTGTTSGTTTGTTSGTTTGTTSGTTTGTTGGTTTGTTGGTTTGTTGGTTTGTTGGTTTASPEFGFQLDHDGHGHGHDGGSWNWNWNFFSGNQTTGTTTGGITPSPCHGHSDNGKHKGWTNKIDNLINHLQQLEQQVGSLQSELQQLLQWSQSQNGSTTNTQALQDVQSALTAKDQAGEASSQDLAVLAETQDQMNNVSGSITTLEKAVSKDQKNPNLYNQLAAQFVKKGDHSIKVFVDGAVPNFDVTPTIINNRTMVPLHAIGDALKATVKWDQATKTITLKGQNGTNVTLKANSNIATVNGQSVTLDQPATIVNGRTLVPLHALGTFFGLNVTWNQDAEMAVLN